MTYDKILLSLVSVAIMSGCVTHEMVRLSPDQIIMPAQTDYGREVNERLLKDFEAIIREVQMADLSYTLRFAEGVIRGVARKEEPGIFYLQFHLLHDVIYNSLQTTYQQRAASTYARHLFALSRIISGHPRLFEEDKIIGFNIFLEWQAGDLSKQGTLGFVAAKEDMFAFIPKEVLRDFAATKISIQELGRRTIFISSLGKTELDFSDTL